MGDRRAVGNPGRAAQVPRTRRAATGDRGALRRSSGYPDSADSRTLASKQLFQLSSYVDENE